MVDAASGIALAAAVFALTRNAVAFLTGLNEIASRMSDADLDLVALNAQTGLVSIVADRLRTWIDEHEDELGNEERDSLLECVIACKELVEALRSATDKTNTKKSGKLGFRARTRLLFSQPQLDKYANTMAQQVAALNIYLQIFDLSAARRQKALYEPKRMETIQAAMSSASETASQVSSLSADSYNDWETQSSADSGYDEGSDSVHTDEGSQSVDRNTSSVRLTVDNLAEHESHHPQTNSRLFSDLPVRVRDDGRDPDDSSSSSESGETIRDETPTNESDHGRRSIPRPRVDDYDDTESVVSTLESAYDVRDTLERLSRETNTSSAGPNENSVLQNLDKILRDLQQIMLQIRRGFRDDESGGVDTIPPELSAQIRHLFDQVLQNLYSVPDLDDRILRGSHISIVNAKGESALHIAARKGDCAALRHHLSLGASVHVIDNDGNTPLLSQYIEYSKLSWDQTDETASILLNAQADVNFSRQDGVTALHLASRSHAWRLVEMLISRGANVNAVSRLPGLQTPLHSLSQYICRGKIAVAIAELLLRAGADTQHLNTDGKRPLDNAISFLAQTERSIASTQEVNGKMWSILWRDKETYDECLIIIGLFLKYSPMVTLHVTSRNQLKTLFTFKRMKDIETPPIEEIRQHFRARQAKLLLKELLDIYHDIKIFYGT